MSIWAWSPLMAASAGYKRGLLVVALAGLVPGAEQFRITFEVELRARELGLVLLRGGLGLFQCVLVGSGINLEKWVALFYLLAFLEIYLDDLTIDPVFTATIL